jgi:hypothetical protein
MKRKFLLPLVALGLITLIISSCYKDPLKDLTEDESRIYITNYDTSVNFSNYATYSIADSVAVVSNNNGSVRKTRTSADAAYIAAVDAALQQRGYAKVSHDQQPDLGVTVSRIMSNYTQVVSYTDYDYYGSYWDPFYWGYPGYNYYFPTYYGVYNINEEAIAIDVVDLKNVHNNQLRSVWSGVIRGSGINNPRTIESQVMQLFNQSSYFRIQ